MSEAKSETSADYPHFRVRGVSTPLHPEETARLLDWLESSGSQFALSAAAQAVSDLSHGRQVELGEPEALEAIRAIEALALAGPLSGGLGALHAQLVAWRDLY